MTASRAFHALALLPALAISAAAQQPAPPPHETSSTPATRAGGRAASGAVDEFTINRPDNIRTPSAAVERIRQLSPLRLYDHVIAEKLNAEGVKSGTGRAWTSSAVKHVPLNHNILSSTAVLARRNPLPDRHPDGRYSIPGAMKRFGVSHRQLVRWVECGMVQGTREDFGGYRSVWWLTIAPETEAQIDKRKIGKQSQNARLAGEGDAL